MYKITPASVVNSALISGIETVPGVNNCTTVPTAPSGLAATAVSSSQINLSWTASTAPSGCTISYNVFRSTTSGFTPSSSNQIATGVSGTSFSNTGLAASTTYFYLVEATDAAGASAASNQASATTLASTTVVPNTPTRPGATAASSGHIDCSCTANTASAGTLAYATIPAPMAVYQTARIGSFTYTITGGFTAGSSHTVRLHFAETYWTAAGLRIFNVTINGTAVLTNFDIFATAGAKNKAVIEQFTENANSSGQYVIQVTPVKDNSLVSGIDVQ